MSARQQRRWEICPHCRGEGRIDGAGVVDPDDYSDEEWDEYVNGGSDIDCGACNGTGKVDADAPAAIVRFNHDGTKSFYADEVDASEHHLRMMGG